MKRLIIILLPLVACRATEADLANGEAENPRGFEPPVMTNPEPPVAYPVELFESGTEGSVILKLFVDATGSVRPDSTVVAESSGIARMDSAAVGGVGAMRFAPARMDGRPVATSFLQPIHFRLPQNRGPEQQ